METKSRGAGFGVFHALVSDAQQEEEGMWLLLSSPVVNFQALCNSSDSDPCPCVNTDL